MTIFIDKALPVLAQHPLIQCQKQILLWSAVIEFGNCALTVIHTPGHTPGSCCLMYTPEAAVDDTDQFIFSEMPYLFDGDVIFKEGIGRTDFQYSKKNLLYKSFQTIKNLGVVRIFPGHGESFVSSDQEILG
jgi:glyoxylase-like metal-dependent hydrolase (beta-lactamase superfamily II)